ncbi:MAG: MFS transporter [Actinobacteria bacterium]|nr:MAG: MFS transporter [Actinomycetota bacterium]
MGAAPRRGEAAISESAVTESLTPLRRNRDFLLFQTGQLLSAVGTSTATIAYPLLTLAVTHSPANAGVVSFAQFLPIVLFSLVSGVVGDRVDRKRMMIASDIVRAVAVTGLVVAILFHELAFWQIVTVSFVEGTGGVFFGAGRSGVFKSVVPKAQLAAAASTEEGRLSVVRLAGPPAGGALFGVGRAVPFLADAVSYTFSTLSLLAMRTPFQERRERADTHVVAEALEGLRFVWHNPFLRLTTLMLTLGGFSAAGVQLAVVVLARQHGLASAGVGGLVALVGATTLLGATASPLVRRVLSPRAILLSEFWSSLVLVSFLVWPSVYVLAAAFAFQAFFFANTDAAVRAHWYAITPDRLIARVPSAMGNVMVLAMPLGPLAAGFLIQSVSPRAAIALFLGVLLVAAAAGTLSRSTRDVPAPDDSYVAKQQA